MLGNVRAPKYVRTDEPAGQDAALPKGRSGGGDAERRGYDGTCPSMAGGESSDPAPCIMQLAFRTAKVSLSDMMKCQMEISWEVRSRCDSVPGLPGSRFSDSLRTKPRQARAGLVGPICLAQGSVQCDMQRLAGVKNARCRHLWRSRKTGRRTVLGGES
jgi:hypothetical protein